MLTESRDRDIPVGYKVSRIAFSNGEPVAPSNSTTATTDIFANADITSCPNNCFRPVGMAIDSVGRIFVSSDATGEVYVIVKDGETAAAPTGTTSLSGTSSPSGTSISTGSSSTATSAACKLVGAGLAAYIAFLTGLINQW